MGFTLGFHIVLACFGVAFPAAMLIAEWHGHRKKDPEALRLARNWSKAVAVLFAVGAVTGTVLSFEFGLLWPRFMGRFGDAFGVGFAIEGIFFFLEAIFIAIYIYGWDRLSPRAHMLAAVPIVISGVGGAFSVIAVNAWMNQPQGFDLDSAGNVTHVRPLEVLFNPATGYEFFHMFLAAYIVTGFLVASVYAVGMLRGRRDRYHRLGFVIPFTLAAIATPIQLFVGDTAARVDRRRPAGQVRGDGVHLQGRAGPDRIPGRPLRRRPGQGWDRDPGPRLVPGRVQQEHRRHRSQPDPQERPAAREDDAAPLLRPHGWDRHGTLPARGLVRDLLVAAARPAGHALVPADQRHRRGGGGGRALVRLDRHRGRPPAVDRERLHAHGRRGDPGPGNLVGVRRDAGPLRRAGGDRDHRAARPLPPLAGGRPRSGEIPYGPPPGERSGASA